MDQPAEELFDLEFELTFMPEVTEDNQNGLGGPLLDRWMHAVCPLVQREFGPSPRSDPRGRAMLPNHFN